MKLLHVITSLGHGGAQRQLMQLCDGLANRGYEQSVATLVDRGEFSRHLEPTGLFINHLGGDRSPWSALQRLRALVGDIRPDLIQAWLYHANIAASLAGSSVPVAWNIRHSLHDLESEKLATRAVIRVGALLSRWPTVVVFNSARSADQHRAAGYARETQRVIDNGIDCERFRRDFQQRVEQRARWGASDNDWVIGMVGRHHRSKGVDIFLRAVAAVSATGTDICTVLVGDGMNASNPEISGVLASLGTPIAVHFDGPQHHVEDTMNGLDVLVSVSSGESSSNVVAEAAAVGATCIVTDVGESPRLVGDSGIVLQERSEACLAHALQGVISDGRERWADRGVRAARHIRESYSVKHCVDAYDRLYRSLIPANATGLSEP